MTRFQKLACFAVTALAMAGTPTHALDTTGAKRLGCFKHIEVPARYRVNKIKIADSYQHYVKRKSGIIELLEFPATYREERILVEKAHTVLRQVPCRD